MKNDDTSNILWWNIVREADSKLDAIILGDVGWKVVKKKITKLIRIEIRILIKSDIILNSHMLSLYEGDLIR